GDEAQRGDGKPSIEHAEDRRQGIEHQDLAEAESPPAHHLPVQVPGDGADAVELEDPLDLEAAVGRQLAQAGLVVAAAVAEHFVEGAEVPLALRYEDDGAAAFGEDAADVAQGSAVVGDVLDDRSEERRVGKGCRWGWWSW